ncbi:MAG: transporter substrate-binding domain-containing protein [Neomegalonema sp.]|nr:transporter substrate-binding domain-containing protein [Neomegalonema sp.]
MGMITRMGRVTKMGRVTSIVRACLAGLLLAAMPSASQAGEVLDRIRSNGKVVIATTTGYPPQSFMGPNGRLQGFDIDVARAIAERLGVAAEFATTTFAAIAGGDWRGRWDIAVASLSPTKTRTDALDFPAIYYFTPAALVVPETDTAISRTYDANGKRFAVAAATSYEAYLRGELHFATREAPRFRQRIKKVAGIETFANDLAALEAVAAGKVDAGISALPTILEAQRSGLGVKVVGGPLFLEPLGVAIEKGDRELAVKLGQIVSDLRRSGSLSKLSEQWYGADLTR